MPNRNDFANHILSFENLNYSELDVIVKKIWMEFEIEWDKKCLNSEGYNKCKGHGEDVMNTGEVMLKKAFSKTYKKLCVSVYENKAKLLSESED